MVPVALVHEGKFAHAIWTVPVAPLLVVADHRRHHSLELEQVEARVVKVADALAITSSNGAGGHPGGRPGEPGGPGGAGGPQGPKGTSKKIEVWRRWIIGLISSFVFRISWG